MSRDDAQVSRVDINVSRIDTRLSCIDTKMSRNESNRVINMCIGLIIAICNTIIMSKNGVGRSAQVEQTLRIFLPGYLSSLRSSPILRCAHQGRFRPRRGHCF